MNASHQSYYMKVFNNTHCRNDDLTLIKDFCACVNGEMNLRSGQKARFIYEVRIHIYIYIYIYIYNIILYGEGDIYI